MKKLLLAAVAAITLLSGTAEAQDYYYRTRRPHVIYVHPFRAPLPNHYVFVPNPPPYALGYRRAAPPPGFRYVAYWDPVLYRYVWVLAPY